MKKHALNDTSLSDDDFYHDDTPSRSAKKREAQAQTDLVPELLALSNVQLRKFTFFDDDFLAGLALMKRMGYGPAYRRQRNYLGKYIRQNEWGAAIESTLSVIKGDSKQAIAMHHRCERWRERLIEEGDEALEALITQFPTADRQAFRQTMRAAKQERAQQKTPKQTRLLFKMIKALHEPLLAAQVSEENEENSDNGLD